MQLRVRSRVNGVAVMRGTGGGVAGAQQREQLSQLLGMGLRQIVLLRGIFADIVEIRRRILVLPDLNVCFG